jgi:hypothetical protein
MFQFTDRRAYAMAWLSNYLVYTTIGDRQSRQMNAVSSRDWPELKPMEHNMGQTVTGPDIADAFASKFGGEDIESSKVARETLTEELAYGMDSDEQTATRDLPS